MPDIEAEPTTAPTFHTDRPSSRSTDEREAHYRAWLARYGDPYVEATLAAGGIPWFTDDSERRALWERRYTQPAPPADLTNNPPWRTS